MIHLNHSSSPVSAAGLPTPPPFFRLFNMLPPTP